MIREIQEAQRFSDESDRAADLERIAQEEGVKRVLNRIEKAPQDFDGTNCYDCDNQIPKARLDTGAFRCIAVRPSTNSRSAITGVITNEKR